MTKVIAINELIGQKASQYSRSQILLGSTQLENNAYDANTRIALKQSILDIRELLRDNSDFFLNVDNTIRLFEQRIFNCKKFSIGNCFELASMALHYLVTEKPEINAEVYSLEGGDHALLVIGRTLDSDPSRPETWGDEAYICDPWSDDVYPAREYLIKTKNFYQLLAADGDYTNHIEDFNPLKHQLCPVANLNTSYILSTTAKSNTILLDVFLTINQKYLSIYDDFVDDLDKIANRLAKNYGSDDAKLKIIQAKIAAIRTVINELKEKVTKHIEDVNLSNSLDGYLAHKDVDNNLQQIMKTQLRNLNEHRIIAADDLNILNEYNRKDSLITMIMKFLQIKPRSSQDYSRAVKKSEDQLEDFSNLINSTFKK